MSALLALLLLAGTPQQESDELVRRGLELRREGKNEFVGKFHVVANEEAGIDGASETDCLDVTSASLGAGLEQGLLVVQDVRNLTPSERQNFKLIPWSRIATALGLTH